MYISVSERLLDLASSAEGVPGVGFVGRKFGDRDVENRRRSLRELPTRFSDFHTACPGQRLLRLECQAS